MSFSIFPALSRPHKTPSYRLLPDSLSHPALRLSLSQDAREAIRSVLDKIHAMFFEYGAFASCMEDLVIYLLQHISLSPSRFPNGCVWARRVYKLC